MKHLKLFESFEKGSSTEKLAKDLAGIRSRMPGATGFIPTRAELLELQEKFKKGGWRTKMARSYMDTHEIIDGVRYKYMTLRIFNHKHWSPSYPEGYQCIFKVSEPEELPVGYSGKEVKADFTIEEKCYYFSGKPLSIAPPGYNPDVECPYQDLLENNPLNGPITRELFDNLYKIVRDRSWEFSNLNEEDVQKYLNYKPYKYEAPAKKPEPEKYDLAIDMADLPEQPLNQLVFLRQLCWKHGLEISNTNPYGPSGGFPEITFRGELNSLKALLVDLEYTDDADDLEELLSTAKPVQ